MARRGRIEMRCDSHFKDILKIYAINYQLPISEFVRSVAEDYVSKNVGYLDKKLQEKVKKLLLEKDLKDVSKEWKNDNRKIYLIKNFIVMISNMLLSSYILTRTLNMDIVNFQIDYAKKVYKKFPLKIRKMLKTEMLFIEKCKSESFLQERFNYMLQLKDRKLLK